MVEKGQSAEENQVSRTSVSCIRFVLEHLGQEVGSKDSTINSLHSAQVQAGIRYLESLLATRRTDEYRDPQRREFYGILPPSISHEGYAAKPMHSYWDDFWALRGYRDAVWLAGAVYVVVVDDGRFGLDRLFKRRSG